MRRGFYSLSGLIHDVMGKDICVHLYQSLLYQHEVPSHGVWAVCDLSNHPTREKFQAARY